MKKAAFLLILTIIFTVITAGSSQTASADAVYARVVSENSAFYSDAGATMVKFILPVGYFVKIKEVGNDYSRVTYMDGASGSPQSEGYVSNADLKFGEKNVVNPYPKLTVTVKCDDVLFSDVLLSHPRLIITEGSNAIYYGTQTLNGEKYLYVYINGAIGYVHQTAFNEFEVPPHPTYNTSRDSSSSQSQNASALPEQKNESPAKNNSQIIVIGIIILAALALFYLILRPEKRRAQEHSYYSDKDDA